MSAKLAPERHALRMCLQFTVLAPITLVLWLMALPTYAWIVGKTALPILKYVVREPVLDIVVSKTGFLNIGTSLGFALADRTRMMPDIGHLLTNIAPYVALVLATPRLAWKKRLVILVIGIAIMFAFHVATIILRYTEGRASLPTVFGFIAITLPFLLWIVLAYWDKLIAYIGDDDSTHS